MVCLSAYEQQARKWKAGIRDRGRSLGHRLGAANVQYLNLLADQDGGARHVSLALFIPDKIICSFRIENGVSGLQYYIACSSSKKNDLNI